MRLDKLLAQYTRDHTLEPDTVRYYRSVVRSFSEFLGRHAKSSDLTMENGNRWIDWLTSKGCTPSYRKSQRNGLLALWRYAQETGSVNGAPAKIKRIPLPEMFFDSWTVDEVRGLLRACKFLYGPFRGTSVMRCSFMRLVIIVAWETGLRGSDIFRLEMRQLEAKKFIAIQKKTRKRVQCEISDSTLAKIRRLKRGDHPLACPVSKESFRRTFAKVVERAILDGSFKKLRGSSGTHVESKKPGTGHLHLGNSRRVFEKYYCDMRPILDVVPRPEEL